MSEEQRAGLTTLSGLFKQVKRGALEMCETLSPEDKQKLADLRTEVRRILADPHPEKLGRIAVTVEAMDLLILTEEQLDKLACSLDAGTQEGGAQ